MNPKAEIIIPIISKVYRTTISIINSKNSLIIYILQRLHYLPHLFWCAAVDYSLHCKIYISVFAETLWTNLLLLRAFTYSATLRISGLLTACPGGWENYLPSFAFKLSSSPSTPFFSLKTGGSSNQVPAVDIPSRRLVYIFFRVTTWAGLIASIRH